MSFAFCAERAATYKRSFGTPWAGAYRFSRVFVKRDGIWKTMLYQDTELPKAAKQ
jgi:hypothetical protein